MSEDASEGRLHGGNVQMADAGTFGLTCQKAGQPSDGSRPCKTWLAELPKLSPMPNAAIDGMAKAGQVTSREAAGKSANGAGKREGEDACPTIQPGPVVKLAWRQLPGQQPMIARLAPTAIIRKYGHRNPDEGL